MNTPDTKHESDSTSTDSTTLDNEFESRTMRKVDWRLIPLFGLLSAVAIMDRANLGTAKLTGMDEALHTNIGSRYNIVTAVYFIPNLFCQVPSNLALRYIGVQNWLAFCVAAWGVIGLSAGFVTNWKQLALCRLLLGCFEAGLYPAIVLTITTWYKRHEVQQRLAAFQIVISFTASIGMMIGYGLSCLDGVLGRGGWSWLFILEGAITLVIGIVAWFFIPSFPDQNSFLTEEQTRWVLERIEKDRGDAEPDRIHFKKFLLILTDWKIWVYVIMHFCAIMPTLALAYFSNIILSAMGWSNAMSIFLANPPYLFGTLMALVVSFLADKYRHRSVFLFFQIGIASLGLAMVGFLLSSGWRYAGMCLAVGGSMSSTTTIIAYSANNVVSQTKRAVSTALLHTATAVSGIVGVMIFQQKDYPHYRPGLLICLGAQVVELILLIGLTTYLWTRNKKSKAGLVVLEGQEGFLYTL